MLTRRFEGPVGGSDKSAGFPAEIDLACAADFRIGHLHVQPSTLQACFDEIEMTLEPRVMQALVALATVRGTVVSRDGLVDLCWNGRAVSEDAINRCIAKLRKLGAESKAFEVETIPRVGHRLRENGKERVGDPRSGRSRRWPWLAAGLAILVLAVVAALLIRERGTDNVDRPKVAVLGFRTLNAGADAQHYADSVAATVSDALVTVGADLDTPSVSGSKPTAEAARQAGASFLISGTVRREGALVRVTAQITAARGGATLLSKEFDVPAAEAALAPDRVAAFIADRVGSWHRLFRNERDPDRLAALIRIQTSWYEDGVRAYRLSRELAEAAPNSAVAQEVFASTTAFNIDDLPQGDRKEAVEAARKSARRAQALLPRYDSGFVLDCWLKPPGRMIITAKCDERMRQAIASDPDDYFTAAVYAELLADSGLYAAAEPWSQKAVALAPFNPQRIGQRLSILSMITWRQDEVPGLEMRARRYWGSPGPIDIGRYSALLGSGAMEQAETVLNDPVTGPMIEADPAGPAHLVFKALRSGKREDKEAAAAACVRPPPAPGPPDFVLGTCLVGLAELGDLDSVFALAELYGDPFCCSPAEIERKWLWAGGLTYPRRYLFASSMAKARADPRFIRVARRTGLLAYWKAKRPPDFCKTERAPVCELL